MKIPILSQLIPKLRAVRNGFIIGLEEIGAGILVFMALLITVEAIGRTVFGFSTRIAYELIGILTVCVGFIGLAATFRKGAHIRIIAIMSRFPKKMQYYIDVIAIFLVLIYASILFRYTLALALYSLRVEEISWSAIPFPVYPFKIMLPVGILALILILPGKIYTLIKSKRSYLEGENINLSDELKGHL